MNDEHLAEYRKLLVETIDPPDVSVLWGEDISDTRALREYCRSRLVDVDIEINRRRPS